MSNVIHSNSPITRIKNIQLFPQHRFPFDVFRSNIRNRQRFKHIHCMIPESSSKFAASRIGINRLSNNCTKIANKISPRFPSITPCIASDSDLGVKTIKRLSPTQNLIEALKEKHNKIKTFIKLKRQTFSPIKGTSCYNIDKNEKNNQHEKQEIIKLPKSIIGSIKRGRKLKLVNSNEQLISVKNIEKETIMTIDEFNITFGTLKINNK